MNAMRLAQTLASNPFLQFAKLSTVNKNGQEHLQLGFDAFLKNHIGTLHAGALFTAAQADAQASLELALEQENKEWRITGYTSQIAYKRPAKGAVWVHTEAPEIEWDKGVAHTLSTLNNEANEPLAELRIQFTLAQGER